MPTWSSVPTTAWSKPPWVSGSSAARGRHVLGEEVPVPYRLDPLEDDVAERRTPAAAPSARPAVAANTVQARSFAAKDHRRLPRPQQVDRRRTRGTSDQQSEASPRTARAGRRAARPGRTRPRTEPPNSTTSFGAEPAYPTRTWSGERLRSRWRRRRRFVGDGAWPAPRAPDVTARPPAPLRERLTIAVATMLTTSVISEQGQADGDAAPAPRSRRRSGTCRR